jgi:hypothetical protein
VHEQLDGAESAPPPRRASAHAPNATGLLRLQGQVGNQAVARLVADFRDEASSVQGRTVGPGPTTLIGRSPHGNPSLLPRSPADATDQPGDSGVVAQRDDAGTEGRDGGTDLGSAGGAAAAGAGSPPGGSPLPTVTFGAVRADPSPAGTKDRIAPGRGAAVTVAVAGGSGATPPLELSVAGSGDANGTATFSGAPTTQITGSGTVIVTGGSQTAPGNGGNLVLTARQGGATGSVVGVSAGFSVSAFPQNWSDAFAGVIRSDRLGVAVQDGWESDGTGGVAELDQTQIREVLQYGDATGCFAEFTHGNPSPPLAGNVFTKDQHTVPISVLTGPGVLVVNQLSVVTDLRSGSNDFAVTNSGFQITRTVDDTDREGLELEVKKEGASVTAEGFTSAAGSASIDRSEPV